MSDFGVEQHRYKVEHLFGTPGILFGMLLCGASFYARQSTPNFDPP